MKKLFLSSYRIIAMFLLLSAAFVSCSDDNSEPLIPTIGGIDAKYEIDRCQLLELNPSITNATNAIYTWRMSNASLNIKDSVIGRSANLLFITTDIGTYDMKLHVQLTGLYDTIISTQTIVRQEKVAYSPYITKVYDYFPAIGQFVNELPAYVEGDTRETMIQKAETAIVGPSPSMIHLGGFGGYVEFGFDHTIVNVPGKRDFRVKGNAFWAATNPNPEAPGRGGSCEPGIIMVAYDKNKNGKPDEDEWYEIAGSEYYKSTTIKDYEITFYRPEVEEPGAKDDYIRWEDNQSNSGYKPKNMFHGQSYFPRWTNEDKITFKGTLLPNNAVDESGSGSYWVLYSYAYGYADNAPNNDNESAIDINWAVDANGKKVNLPGIDFVKVYTGINQEAGWLGEVSTEVAGAEDLHLLGISISTRN